MKKSAADPMDMTVNEELQETFPPLSRPKRREKTPHIKVNAPRKSIRPSFDVRSVVWFLEGRCKASETIVRARNAKGA